MCQILTFWCAKCANVFKLNEFQFWDRISAAFIELNWNPRDFFCNFHSNRIKSSITSMKSIIYHLYNLYIYTSIINSTFILLYENSNYYPPAATVFRCPFQLFPLFAMDSGLNIELVKWFSVGSLMLVSVCSCHLIQFTDLRKIFDSSVFSSLSVQTGFTKNRAHLSSPCDYSYDVSWECRIERLCSDDTFSS